jgi:hypothetical protein
MRLGAGAPNYQAHFSIAGAKPSLVANMNIDSIEKKLREAQFFLERMREQEQRAFGDRDPLDFFLSAFLSAVRTVDYRLRHECGLAAVLKDRPGGGVAADQDRRTTRGRAAA